MSNFITYLWIYYVCKIRVIPANSGGIMFLIREIMCFWLQDIAQRNIISLIWPIISFAYAIKVLPLCKTLIMMHTLRLLIFLFALPISVQMNAQMPTAMEVAADMYPGWNLGNTCCAFCLGHQRLSSPFDGHPQPQDAHRLQPVCSQWHTRRLCCCKMALHNSHRGDYRRHSAV